MLVSVQIGVALGADPRANASNMSTSRRARLGSGMDRICPRALEPLDLGGGDRGIVRAAGLASTA
jgi:hypothetical protein